MCQVDLVGLMAGRRLDQNSFGRGFESRVKPPGGLVGIALSAESHSTIRGSYLNGAYVQTGLRKSIPSWSGGHSTTHQVSDPFVRLCPDDLISPTK